MIKQAENLLETQAKNYLRKIFISTTPLSGEALNSLINSFSHVSYKKNHEIIEEGKIADSFYFVFKGVVRIYFFKNEKRVIERFEKEGGFFGGNFSHVNKSTGTFISESVEDVELLRIKFSDLEALCKKFHEIERLYRVSMEFFHSGYVDRIFLFKSLSSEERYREFIRQNSDLANRISLKDIANYLGMTPETLSRIRAKYDSYQ